MNNSVRSSKLWIERSGRSRTSRRLLPQAGGKDQAQDGVIFGIDHHLVLILAEVLNRIALTGIAIKGRNHELLGKFIFQYALRKGGIGR